LCCSASSLLRSSFFPCALLLILCNLLLFPCALLLSPFAVPLLPFVDFVVALDPTCTRIVPPACNLNASHILHIQSHYHLHAFACLMSWLSRVLDSSTCLQLERISYIAYTISLPFTCFCLLDELVVEGFANRFNSFHEDFFWKICNYSGN